MAKYYPSGKNGSVDCKIIGVDGDKYSVKFGNGRIANVRRNRVSGLDALDEGVVDAFRKGFGKVGDFFRRIIGGRLVRNNGKVVYEDGNGDIIPANHPATMADIARNQNSRIRAFIGSEGFEEGIKKSGISGISSVVIGKIKDFFKKGEMDVSGSDPAGMFLAIRDVDEFSRILSSIYESDGVFELNESTVNSLIRKGVLDPVIDINRNGDSYDFSYSRYGDRIFEGKDPVKLTSQYNWARILRALPPSSGYTLASLRSKFTETGQNGKREAIWQYAPKPIVQKDENGEEHEGVVTYSDQGRDKNKIEFDHKYASTDDMYTNISKSQTSLGVNNDEGAQKIITFDGVIGKLTEMYLNINSLGNPEVRSNNNQDTTNVDKHPHVVRYKARMASKDSYTPMLLWGAPGIGKTASVNYFVKMMAKSNPGFSFVNVDLRGMTSGDIMQVYINRYSVKKYSDFDSELQNSATHDMPSTVSGVERSGSLVGAEDENGLGNKDSIAIDRKGKSEDVFVSEVNDAVKKWIPCFDKSGNDALDCVRDMIANGGYFYTDDDAIFNKDYAKFRSGGSDGEISNSEYNDFLKNHTKRPDIHAADWKEGLDYENLSRWYEGDGGIIFMDELSRANFKVMNSVMSMCSDRTVGQGDTYLGTKWILVFASNRMEDLGKKEKKEAGGDDSAIIDRFRQYIYVMPFEEWIKYAETKVEHGKGEWDKTLILEDIINFLNNNKDFFYLSTTMGGTDTQYNMFAKATPRSWSKLSAELKSKLPSGIDSIQSDIDNLKKKFEKEKDFNKRINIQNLIDIFEEEVNELSKAAKDNKADMFTSIDNMRGRYMDVYKIASSAVGTLPALAFVHYLSKATIFSSSFYNDVFDSVVSQINYNNNNNYIDAYRKVFNAVCNKFTNCYNQNDANKLADFKKQYNGGSRETDIISFIRGFFEFNNFKKVIDEYEGRESVNIDFVKSIFAVAVCALAFKFANALSYSSKDDANPFKINPGDVVSNMLSKVISDNLKKYVLFDVDEYDWFSFLDYISSPMRDDDYLKVCLDNGNITITF